MPVIINTTKESCNLHFSGELNIYQAAELMAQIKAELKKDTPLNLDLSEVDEIDASGLQILIALKVHAISYGQPLNMLSLSDSVMELLELSDLAGFFGATVVLTDIAA